MAYGPLLSRYRRGKPGSVIGLKKGRAKLAFKYDEDGQLLVLEVRGATPRIYFDWTNNMHALKSPMSVGGTQWTGGVVVTGTVYGDGDGSGGGGRRVSLDDWVSECIELMLEASRK